MITRPWALLARRPVARRPGGPAEVSKQATTLAKLTF